MRKLLTLLIALALTAGVSVSSFGGSMMLTGVGKPAGGGVTGWCSLIAQSGLTNCWPYDTTYTTTSVATDPVGSKNATLTSVTLNGSGPSANLNNAGVFNGTTSIGTTTLANVPTAAFTVNIWLNQINSNGPRMFSNDNPGNNGFMLWSDNGVPADAVSIGNGTTSLTVDSTIPVSTWTMLTWTYDGTTLKVYKNGVAGSTGTLAGPITAGGNNLSFGFLQLCTCGFYQGMIAGTAIWNRALTAGEVSTLAGL